MLTWLAYVGPGAAAIVASVILAQSPATKDAASALGLVGGLYLLIIAPVYKRRWKARRQARGWYDRERAKEPYRRRLPRTRDY